MSSMQLKLHRRGMIMTKKKKMYIRNDVVYDPNIDFPTVFDPEYEDVTLLKKKYHAGKWKRKPWRGK
jgi:hypothetical protein